MSKSRRDWIAISVVIGLLWLFPLFGLCVRLAYRGHEPEPLHALTVAYGMAVFFGAPVMALILTISIIYARNLGERGAEVRSSGVRRRMDSRPDSLGHYRWNCFDQPPPLRRRFLSRLLNPQCQRNGQETNNPASRPVDAGRWVSWRRRKRRRELVVTARRCTLAGCRGSLPLLRG
jgi:hypothetical protein